MLGSIWTLGGKGWLTRSGELSLQRMMIDVNMGDEMAYEIPYRKSFANNDILFLFIRLSNLEAEKPGFLFILRPEWCTRQVVNLVTPHNFLRMLS